MSQSDLRLCCLPIRIELSQAGLHIFLERVMGIEPTLAAWEAAVLPLNYTRISKDCIRASSQRATAQAIVI
jgi:hypothetical protein